jgi:hypothetical protein
MIDPVDVSFYEAPLVGIIHVGSFIILEIERTHVKGDHYDDPDEEGTDLRVILSGVSAVKEEGIPIPELSMKFSYGNILNLSNINSNTVELLVSWSDFVNHTHPTILYEITCTGLRIERWIRA